MYKITKRTMWVFIIIISVVALALFPVLVNWIMFQSPPIRLAAEGVSQNATWIGFFATYFGAILGGIISGAITLLGVIMTIKSQDRKELINSYPQKRMAGDDIVHELRFIVDGLFTNLDEGHYGLISSACLNVTNKAETLLFKASKIDGNCYIILRRLINEANACLKAIKVPLFYEGTMDEYRISQSDNYREHIRKLIELRESFLKAFSKVVYEYEKVKL